MGRIVILLGVVACMGFLSGCASFLEAQRVWNDYRESAAYQLAEPSPTTLWTTCSSTSRRGRVSSSCLTTSW